jgi:16S rRNA (guanine966-N2)-methyltransferase
MRIISGKYKGRRISPPKNLPVRPTTDMSKEALFNVLNNHFNFSELRVLDLFAGTGNISFEFASRGSISISAVDQDFGCVKFIKQTADEFDFPISATKSDVFSFIERSKSSYDVIFVLSILENNLLNPDGMMVIEHSKYTKLDHLENFSFKKSYGGSIFSFFEFENLEDEEMDDEEDEG